MRGADTFAESLFTMRHLDDFVPAQHPLRPIREMVNQALKEIEPLLCGMYAADVKGARPSIAPEKLLRAMLLQIFYSIRSERQLMEQTQYNLLFRWFIGLSLDDVVWVPTVFTKNRERLIAHDAVIELFNAVLAIAEKQNWLSGEHFSVDGTLIQAWAGHKSFLRKEGGDDDGGNFKGQPRSNDTHASRTDPDARLYRKGNTASELRYMGHTLSDNRHGLIASAVVTTADGHAEREAAKAMIADARQVADETAEITLGADKGYDAREFIDALTELNVLPHVAQNTSHRRSAVPDEIADSDGYAISQQKRKLIEQGFGWAKFIGPIRQVMVRGLGRVDQLFVLTMAAYNLTRMRTLGAIRLLEAR
jgi:transposase